MRRILRENYKLRQALYETKKSNEALQKRIDEAFPPKIEKEPMEDLDSPSLLKRFADDSDIKTTLSLLKIGSVSTGAVKVANHALNEVLDKDQRARFVERTKNDFVTIEHLNNNMLITEFYQDPCSLFGTIKENVVKKPWYKFW